MIKILIKKQKKLIKLFKFHFTCFPFRYQQQYKHKLKNLNPIKSRQMKTNTK